MMKLFLICFSLFALFQPRDSFFMFEMQHFNLDSVFVLPINPEILKKNQIKTIDVAMYRVLNEQNSYITPENFTFHFDENQRLNYYYSYSYHDSIIVNFDYGVQKHQKGRVYEIFNRKHTFFETWESNESFFGKYIAGLDSNTLELRYKNFKNMTQIEELYEGQWNIIKQDIFDNQLFKQRKSCYSCCPDSCWNGSKKDLKEITCKYNSLGYPMEWTESEYNSILKRKQIRSSSKFLYNSENELVKIENLHFSLVSEESVPDTIQYQFFYLKNGLLNKVRFVSTLQPEVYEHRFVYNKN